MSTETMEKPVADDVALAELTDAMRESEREIERLTAYKAQRNAKIDAEIKAHQDRLAEIRESAHAYLGQVGATKVVLPDVGTWYTQTRKTVAVTDQAAAEDEARSRGLIKVTPDLAALKKVAREDGEVIPGLELVAVESIAFRGR